MKRRDGDIAQRVKAICKRISIYATLALHIRQHLVLGSARQVCRA